MKQTMRIIGLTLILLLFWQVSVSAQSAPDNGSLGTSITQDGIIFNLLQKAEHFQVLYPYEESYFLFTSTNQLNRESIAAYPWADGAKDQEIEYQISLAIPLLREPAGDNSVLAISYTQRSWWQAFSNEISSPFRETNYEPQLFLAWAMDYPIGGWSLREIEIGLNHQSNGRANPTSRGWNRGYARVMATKDNWQIELKPWLVIGPIDSSNNPDITKYLGYYRLKISHRWKDSLVTLQGHYNWNTGYGGAKLNWSYQIRPHLRIFTQLFSGYGESLIDYNYNQTRLGIGFCGNDLP